MLIIQQIRKTRQSQAANLVVLRKIQQRSKQKLQRYSGFYAGSRFGLNLRVRTKDAAKRLDPAKYAWLAPYFLYRIVSGIFRRTTSSIKILTVVSCLWLSGCATFSSMQPPGDQDLSWNERIQKLSTIQKWNINALIAVRSPQDSWTATLNWQQTKPDYTLLLFGPLGTNTVKLTGNSRGVTLETTAGKKVQAHSAEALLAQETGWQLPVSNLYYWIRGLPAPNSPHKKQWDAYHHLMILHQQGWTIRYLHYVSVNRIDVPSKIFLENSNWNVKIVINQWDF